MNTYLLSIFSIRLLYDEINKITKNNPNTIRINFDESNINDVIEECSYLSLLDEEKIVVVNNFKLNDETKKIEGYLKNPNMNTKLVLIVDKLDKRNAIYKLINEKGIVIELKDLKPSEVRTKINGYTKDKGINLDYLALNKLMDDNLGNYDLVLSEIDKMSVISNNIDLKLVTEYGSRIIGDANFDLCDAITNKNLKDIPSLFEDFVSSKEEVLPFIALLSSQYRLIYATKAISMSDDELGRFLGGIHPYRIQLAKEKARLYSKEELLNDLVLLSDMDLNIKKSQMIDPYSLLRIFIINID